MKATDLGYTYEDVMERIEHFRFAKTLANHTSFFTKHIAEYIKVAKTSSNQSLLTEAKRHVHRMTSHYNQLTNEYADAWIDLKKHWNDSEIYSVSRYPTTTFYSVPKGTDYKNCDTDMDNQRIEFYYLGKLITPQELPDNLMIMIPKSNELHIRSNPFALTRCVIYDEELQSLVK
jgi:hypothetical protein